MQFYTIKEVADLMNVHENTIRNWMKSGKLKSYKFDKAVRISKDDLKDFVASSERQVDNQ